MAVGRITGPLLKADLLREGVNLAFETDLLYIDVNNGRIGIKTATPDYELDVNGTARTTNLIVTNQSDIATFTISGDTIASTNGTINLEPSGTNPVVYQGKLLINNNLQVTTNAISTTDADADLAFNTSGTGQVNVNSNMFVDGNLHATGNITADGDITIGSANNDNVVFNADVNSNIIPEVWKTGDPGVPGLYADGDPKWDLGSVGQRWKTAYIRDIQATNFNSNSITVNGIDLALPQGNIYYVAKNGNNTNAGEHEHDPFLTVKYALSQATVGDTVYIYPGEYLEEFPLTVPQGVTVKGAGLRAVTIKPTIGTNELDAFILNGETTVEDLTVSDFFYNSGDNTGYGFRFSDDFTVTSRSPYVRNITVVTRGSVTSVSDPYGFDQNDAGKGALLDGSVANALSREAAMLFHSCTFFTPNQETITATNGVRIEWLNSFTYFADKGLYAYSSSTGFAGAGLTRLRIDNRTGTWAVGNTLNYYDTDGTTVLGTGTITSIDGNYVNLTGRQLGFETITDRTPTTVYAQGNAKLSTAEKKFGTASLALDGVGDYISHATAVDFGFGTGDFCLEAWVYPTSTGTYRTLFDLRTATPSDGGGIVLGITDANQLYFYHNFSFRVGPVGTILQNTWTHIALSRSSGNTRAFINGTQVGSTYVDTNSYATRPVKVGADPAGNFAFTGYIDDVRISKGVARYTVTFTAPTSALTGDLGTVLLLHFNGNNNSTTFLDDGITFQDLRTSAGGTATIINFADYSDFGAEIRAIGSANVYGNYGAYGTGVGVIAYLISQNFAYIGSGKLTTNDPNDQIAVNEVVEEAGAKIYYTSVDNEGNFKVGDAFYVNQKTGEVLFNNQNLTITSLNGVTFTDGVNTTTITSTDITTGNIRIHDNNIDSTVGQIDVTAANGVINLQNNTFITGNLDVTGDITIGGNITIGDQSTDTINFIASIDSNLVPSTTAFYDLGTSLLRWNTAFLSRAEIDGVVIDSNQINTTIGDDDLTLTAAGAGRVYIPNNNVQIDQSLTVTQDVTVTSGTTYLKNTGITGTITQTGDINQTGNFVTSGNTQVTGNITGSTFLQLPQIRLENNVISTTVTNLDLELRANGTGNVILEGIKFSDNNIQSVVTNSNITLVPQGTGGIVINSTQSIQIPVGTNLQQPATPSNGMIRYNSDLTRYEGYNNGYWVKLGGLQDVDGNTKIIAEATPGANDNTLYFYAAGNLTATIDSTKLFAQRFQTVNLDLYSNTISPIIADSNLNLRTTGTGGVRLGNLKIFNNTITNIVSGAITEFSETGTGYVRIAGTNGVVIPSGDTLNDRPAVPEVGMIRFNTFENLVEVFNGVTWSSVAGASGGVTSLEATDLGIAAALIFG